MTTDRARSIVAEVKWSDACFQRARLKVLPPTEISRGNPRGSIVLTKGVFDVLHSGHLALFSLMGELRAAMSGLSIVAVATDDVVRAKKGLARPFLSFAERSLQVALHPDIDVVVPNTSADLGALISELRPVIYVKGQDTALGLVTASLDSSEEKSVTIEESLNPEISALIDCQTTVIVFRDNGNMSTSELVRRIGRTIPSDQNER